MGQSVHELLAGWESFYVISGSVAGALIGLQFVVIALVAESRRRATGPEIAAFGTPTVLHFSVALLLAALLTVPWTSLTGVQIAAATCGAAGVLYDMITIWRAGHTKEYQPGLEDWVWHAALPLTAHLTLIAAATLLSQRAVLALGLIAGVTLGLVFIGIHNSWDTITFIATDARHRGPDATRSARD